MPRVISFLSSRAVVVKNIVMDRIRSKSKKLSEALKRCKTDSDESSDAIKINEERLVKAYYVASLPHLKTIEVINFKKSLGNFTSGNPYVEKYIERYILQLYLYAYEH